MGIERALQWRQIPVSLAELCLDTTLRCGQSFRYVNMYASLLVSNQSTLDGGSQTKFGLVLFTDVSFPCARTIHTFTTQMKSQKTCKRR